MLEPVTPGNYCYTRPGHDRPYPVIVEARGNQLYVRFQHNVSPVRWKDIPDDAVFTPREGDTPCRKSA